MFLSGVIIHSEAKIGAHSLPNESQQRRALYVILLSYDTIFAPAERNL